jgi:hypothetical protein
VANQNLAHPAEAAIEGARPPKVNDAAETDDAAIVGATGTEIETTTTIAAAITITTAAITITTTISACRGVIATYLETGGRNTGDPWATRSAEL